MKKSNLLVLILPIILFSMLTIFIYAEVLTNFEAWAYDKITYAMSPEFTSIAKVITYMGDKITILIICAILLIIPKTRLKYGVWVSLSVIISTAINLLLKGIFMRERPSILPLVIENSYSFPSGHAMMNTSLYVMLIFLVLLYFKNKNVKIVLVILLAFMPIVIGFTRIYLGVHYITDVIGGWILGFFVASILYCILHKKYLK